MSAVLEAREPRASYLAALQPPLVRQFDLLATAPGGVARLRELILTLAVQGKLVPQDASDEPASVLLQKIRAEKNRLIAAKEIKRDKPLAPISDEEISFDAPRGWELVRLGDLVNASEAGWSPSCAGSPRRAGHWGVLKVSAVSWGKFDPEANKELPADLQPKPEYEVRSGDFLLSRANTEELVARSVVVGAVDPRLMLSDKIIRLDVANPIHRGFLNFCNNEKSARTHYAANASGTSSSMKNVSREVVLNLPIALPPLAEQSRIVTRVEELMRLCDALESQRQLETAQHAQLLNTLLGTLTDSASPDELAANWQRVSDHFDLLLDRPQAVDALEQTILQLAVRGLLVPQDPTDEPASVLLQKIRAEKDRLIAARKIKRDKALPIISDKDGLDDLPEGWVVVRLGAIMELVSGQHLGPAEYAEGLDSGIPYLTGPAEFGPQSPSPTRSTVERRAIAIWGDILITVKGSGVGKLNVVAHSEIAISRQLMAVRSIGVNDAFLFIVLKTLEIKFQMQSVGIAIPGIGREDVSHSILGLPPLAEQARIVARVTQLRSHCADLRQRLSARQAIQSHLAEALVEV
ncbi:restriction modification system DNA specificity domain [Leptothrix cholodnii SP-6]|uniref:Restriction modification system DNA specificity domain n=1 Tax=Leptothrix cholodnii (strain ATCC 51168 / LMG 8142 / SP-6) TaxID=395495 RepID=B1Y675_LEPCP|nr:restriction endonuclease subunit S [Leptothrix cholodnii]ACB33580.1 restriction modification system DNA specificity domain [Leptothrix cholodnii SP-6]